MARVGSFRDVGSEHDWYDDEKLRSGVKSQSCLCQLGRAHELKN